MNNHPLTLLISSLTRPPCPDCTTSTLPTNWVSVSKISDTDFISSWLCHHCGTYFSTDPIPFPPPPDSPLS